MAYRHSPRAVHKHNGREYRLDPASIPRRAKASDYVCRQCSQFMMRPVRLHHAGEEKHYLCFSCVSKLNPDRCPFDGKPLTRRNWQVDEGFIAGLRFQCPNSDCEASFTATQDVTGANEHHQTCDNELVPCPMGCQYPFITRVRLPAHIPACTRLFLCECNTLLDRQLAPEAFEQHLRDSDHPHNSAKYQMYLFNSLLPYYQQGTQQVTQQGTQKSAAVQTANKPATYQLPVIGDPDAADPVFANTRCCQTDQPDLYQSTANRREFFLTVAAGMEKVSLDRVIHYTCVTEGKKQARRIRLSWLFEDGSSTLHFTQADRHFRPPPSPPLLKLTTYSGPEHTALRELTLTFHEETGRALMKWGSLKAKGLIPDKDNKYLFKVSI